MAPLRVHMKDVTLEFSVIVSVRECWHRRFYHTFDMASNLECTCISPICNRSDQLQAFKVNAIKRVIECATARHDDDTRKSMQKLLDEHCEQASVNLHKNCYCSYTSKSHIGRYVAKKRKEGLIESEDVPAARVRRSQAVDFDFKNQCLFCAQICVPLDPKHPDRWDRVVQCERNGLKNSEPLKSQLCWYVMIEKMNGAKRSPCGVMERTTYPPLRHSIMSDAMTNLEKFPLMQIHPQGLKFRSCWNILSKLNLAPVNFHNRKSLAMKLILYTCKFK